MKEEQKPKAREGGNFALGNNGSGHCPTSTYRLQMHAGFNFRDAKAILPYLNDLGVEAVYLSPIFTAVPGSMHGYNVTDPAQLNPELGSKADFEAFCDRLKEYKMDMILDIVPNHMGIGGSHNELWMDVLENGRSSVYADFFDIDWQPVKAELKGKVLIPVLGDLYGNILDRQEVQLEFLPETGALKARYFETRFPIDPQTYPSFLEYQVDELKPLLEGKEEELGEYLSVITAFKNLPSRTERDPAKKEERGREKEIAKKRLSELTSRSKPIMAFIESRLKIFNGTKNDPASMDLLDSFLNEQVYRMAYWRTAAEEINYRRFFDINELAAIRTEDERVFEYCHKLVFEWIAEGKVFGLRIDHPDGLYDPPVYFRRLQKKYSRMLSDNPMTNGADADSGGEDLATEKPLYVVVEKILDRKEFLPETWSVQGTVGYDFLNILNGVFVDQNRQKDFSELYESFIGHGIDFDRMLYDKKKLFALVHMASEINMLGHRLNLISEQDRHYRDFTRNNLTLAIREVIACFPVYRTYVSPMDESISERDERYINIAIEKAKAKTPALNPAVYDFLKEVLLLKLDAVVPPEAKKLYRNFVLRFQQITGPLMAKGLEDTSFYVYNRLASLNEVGGDPVHFGYSREEFHRFNEMKLKRWPYGMLSTSTHDTKRGEDARMRVSVLSEMPDQWKSAIARWTLINEKHKTRIHEVPEPRRNTEYLIYQALLAAWPETRLEGKKALSFTERIWTYALKSVREAKTYTNWINPDQEYEEALRKFIFAILDPAEDNRFLEDFYEFQKMNSYLGRLGSLSAVVLKAGSPGMIDTYQGSEFWNDCLVDPDNRRPVDFESRKNVLRGLSQSSHLRAVKEDSLKNITAEKSEALKMRVLAGALRFRKSNPDLFLDGAYIPLKVEGEKERHVIAFMRKKNGTFVVVIATRFFAGLVSNPEELPLGEAVWQDTRVILPADFASKESLKDIFTDKTCAIRSDEKGPVIDLSSALHTLNVAMLTSL